MNINLKIITFVIIKKLKIIKMNLSYYAMILFVPVLTVLGLIFEQMSGIEAGILSVVSVMIYLFVRQCKKDSDQIENEYVD